MRLDYRQIVLTFYFLFQFSGPSLADYVSQGYQLLDVRTEGEFERNTAQGAINIPLAKLDSLTNLLSKYVNCNLLSQSTFKYASQ